MRLVMVVAYIFFGATFFSLTTKERFIVQDNAPAGIYIDAEAP